MHMRILAGSCLALVTGVLAVGCDGCEKKERVAYVFNDDAVISGLDAPTSMSFAKDGSLFVAQKNGQVYFFRSVTDPDRTLVVDLSEAVNSFYDRGIESIAVHPDFPDVPSVFVLYTYDAPIGGTAPVFHDMDNRDMDATASGRLSRLELTRTETGGYVLAHEVVLVHDWCQDASSHSVGGLAFGPDGMLYASAGDSAAFSSANAVDVGQYGNRCGDPAGEGGSFRAQDALTPADPQTLDGAVIRIDPVTGEGAAGNPFQASDDANARRVIAWGLRNPFRLTFEPSGAALWIADVGLTSWEEVNRLEAPYQGANFGWPCYEGPAPQGRFDQTALCRALANDVATGTRVVTEPYFTYAHNEPRTEANPCGGDGASVTGLAFNTGDRYPEQYANGLFVADFARDCVRVLPRGEDGLPDASRQSLVTRAVWAPVDIDVGPDGYLYVLSIHGGSVHRLLYGFPQDGGTMPMTDPRAPIAEITSPAEDIDAETQALITFSGQASDADGVPLPTSALSFKVQIFHCDEHSSTACHIHTLTELAKTDGGSFRLPSDHEFPSYVEIRLRAEVVEAGTRHVGEAVRRVRYAAP